MLASWKVQWIKALLAEGLSRRQVVTKTGASRQSIDKIALGRRPDYQPRGRSRRATEIAHGGPVARCPCCGCRVELPCRVCRARQELEGIRFRPRRPNGQQAQWALRIELREEHRPRYEEIHARKLRERAVHERSDCRPPEEAENPALKSGQRLG